jgi:hypothetical protein
VENALVSSTADHSVEIRGRHNRRDGGYALAVIDGGQGRSPRQLDAANRRPAGEDAFTASPSTYLGHYVAGNLAGRHGIALRLSPGEGGRGVTAVIRLPAALLADSTLGAGSPGGMFGPGGSVPFGPRRGRRGRRSGRPAVRPAAVSARAQVVTPVPPPLDASWLSSSVVGRDRGPLR